MPSSHPAIRNMTNLAPTDAPADAPANAPADALKRPSSTNPVVLFLRYLLPVFLIHVIALLAIFGMFFEMFFSWTGVIVCVVGIHVFGQAITMGYHRLLAHRSFSVPRWFEWTLVVFALCCLQDSPARWVATHRMHHAHSDDDEDPHSPLVTFLWGHMGWLFLRNHDLTHMSNYSKYARDLLQDPFYFWLERNPTAPMLFYLGQCVPYFAVAMGGAMWLGESLASAAMFGTSVVIWGVFVRTVLVWHITWSVNSLTHMFGYQSHETGDHSRNNWLVALVAAGEGWHNNHHQDPAACSLQHRWWEFDLTYWEVRGLKALGIVGDITPCRATRIVKATEKKVDRAADESAGS